MISLYNIWTVGRIEIKTLLRSWFFRIFAGLSVFILFWFNFGVLTKVGEAPWIFRGIPSAIPYANLLLLNAVQAVIAVFLASDFLKRDKKLDTTEVVYMRSMTNVDYVLGKTIGILAVFLGLNVVVLAVATFFNVFLTDVPYNFIAYIEYLALISIPTLVYIFGLSFLFMVLIRNQAVTFIVLLGYIGTTLFFLGNKFHYLFDYMAYNVPLLKSDVVGFGNFPAILTHRGIYFVLGLCFIFATILLLKRLPQSRAMTRFSMFLVATFLIGTVILGNMHLHGISRANSLRARMVELNNEFVDAPRVTPLRCDIDLVHTGRTISSTVKIMFRNATGSSIDRYLFSLNPGLNVEKIVSPHGELAFDRNMHLLSISPENPLQPAQVDSFTMYYGGSIDEDACYLDVAHETREKIIHQGRELFKIDKRYGFITQDYVLLTPENLWYPVVGVTFSSDRPEICCMNFLKFTLTVSTYKDLTAISQGSSVQLQEGRYRFTPDSPIPQLSLAIGRYEKRAVTVDSTDYNLYTFVGHDYFSSQFTAIGDTLSLVIREMKGDFERQLELTYAYPRLNIVEVPVQFFSYQRLWTVSQETVQPEMVLLPEKGVFLSDADFETMQRREDRWRSRSNQVITPRESQARILRRFLSSTFLRQSSFDMFRREGSFIVSANSYNLFPNYFTFVNNIKSEKWPVLNIALEAYLNGRVESMDGPMRFFGGLGAQEKTSLALKDKTLAEILADPGDKDISEIKDVIRAKGSLLFTLLQSKIGDEAFFDFINRFFSENRFRSLYVDEFARVLEADFKVNFNALVDDWYNSRQLPAYLVNGVEAYQVLDENRTRYQVIFNVWNAEPVDGLLMVSFRTGGGGRGGGMGGRGGPDFFIMAGPGASTEVERLIMVKADQVKKVGIVLDDAPRFMSINTMISKNLPSTLDTPFPEHKLRNNAVPFDGEIILDELPNLANGNEIIVDNEDAGFNTFAHETENFLKRFLNKGSSDEEEPYQGLQSWRPPRTWVATVNSDYYGTYVRSAHYTKSGGGERKVTWSAQIAESGNYDIYCYSSNVRMFMRGHWEGGRGGGPGGGPESGRGSGPGGGPGGERGGRGQFHFFVHHDDGVDETIFDLGSAETGWNYLGQFYLSAGTAVVELTNESDAPVVVADAVKWVKR